MKGQVSYQIWLKLPGDIRAKLVQMFHIPRSGSTVVDYGFNGTTVVSDGFKPEDIEAITLEKMQAVMDTDSTDFYGLFEEIILNIDALMQPKPFGEGFAEAIKDLPPISDVAVDMEVGGLVPGGYPTLTKPPFCDQCTSKGGRHLKTCPKVAKHDGQKTTQE